MIPMGEINRSPIKVMLWPNWKQIDLVRFDKRGGITLIETKCALDKRLKPSNKYNVFKQIYRYVKALKNKAYEDIDKVANKSEGESLCDIMKRKTEDFKEDNFKKKVRQILFGTVLGSY